MTGPLLALGQSLPAALADAVGFVTALLAVFVAYQGYRGYRRNDSAPVFYLSLGVLLLTALPFFASEALGSVAGVSDAQVILLIQLLNVAGLVAVLYALTRA
ncbi:MAG: hypothetical protein ABEJ22_09430 [Haloferacaceae archaeon]